MFIGLGCCFWSVIYPFFRLLRLFPFWQYFISSYSSFYFLLMQYLYIFIITVLFNIVQITFYINLKKLRYSYMVLICMLWRIPLISISAMRRMMTFLVWKQLQTLLQVNGKIGETSLSNSGRSLFLMTWRKLTMWLKKLMRPYCLQVSWLKFRRTGLWLGNE